MYATSTLTWSSNATTSGSQPPDYPVEEEEGTSLEDYDELVWKAVEPNWLEYGSLAVFAVLMITGLVGNFLVIFVVIRNECMRTMTNYFLVNLALSDFMVLLICLPFTILWVRSFVSAVPVIASVRHAFSGNHKDMVVRYCLV